MKGSQPEAVTLEPGWATYLRISDEDKQTPERSFAMQRQRINEHLLAQSGLPLVREYRDMLTGTVSHRVDYQQMLADAQAGLFSHLGLYRADRFGRDTVEGLQAATRLIGLGIRIRVAHMPGLCPETPDGFFIFLLQMGMAQREVDVLRQRTRDGMEAKLRAGGWPNKAPEGYVNKEELVQSGKYHRWVEPDPVLKQGLREAWDLLLTGRCTLVEICEELTRRGYTRSGGRPWAWTTGTGLRRHAKNRLHDIFHNPFYAGWVTSERFGIAIGEIRGAWEPVVTTEEFERGVEILRQHGHDKSRQKRHFYLLRNLLWIKVNDRLYQMYGSTPTGREISYAYYITHAKPNGKQIRIPCSAIEDRIPGWLQGISVDPEHLPAIRELYQGHLKQVTAADLKVRLAELQRHTAQLRQEEARLARLFLVEKLSEEVYDQLRAEWQEKASHAQNRLDNLEREVSNYLDDLDTALILLTRVEMLYGRLGRKQRSTLLQILARRIIVDAGGEIIDHELHSPFTYLTSIKTKRPRSSSPHGHGSVHVRLGTPTRTRTWASASGGPRSIL